MIPALICLTLICLAQVGAIVYLLRERRIEGDAVRVERTALLQRIQAPELATLPPLEPVAYVAPDDDEGYWDAIEEREP